MYQMAISHYMPWNAMYTDEQDHKKARYLMIYTIIVSLIISLMIFMNHRRM